jgi:hypothetical protein
MARSDDVLKLFVDSIKKLTDKLNVDKISNAFNFFAVSLIRLNGLFNKLILTSRRSLLLDKIYNRLMRKTNQNVYDFSNGLYNIDIKKFASDFEFMIGDFTKSLKNIPVYKFVDPNSFSEKFKKFFANLFSYVSPTFITGKIKKFFASMFSKIGNIFSYISPATLNKNIIKPIKDKLLFAFEKLKQYAIMLMPKGIGGMQTLDTKGIFKDVIFKDIPDAIADIARAIGDAAKITGITKAFNFIKDKLYAGGTVIADTITKTISANKQVLAGIFTTIADTITKTISANKQVLAGIFTTITDTLKATAKANKQVIGDWVKYLFPTSGINVAKSTVTLIKGFGFALEGLYKTTDFVIKNLFKLAFAAAFFVNAFNPALVQEFMYNLRDLQAVIGTALVPILRTFTVLFRAVADTFYPIFNNLSGLFASLGDALSLFLIPIFNALAMTISSMTNVFNDILGPAIEQIAYSFGNLVALIINIIAPAFQILAQILYILAPIIEWTVWALSKLNQYIPILSAAFLGLATVISVAAIQALYTFIASVWTASNVLTLGLASVIGLIVSGLSWLFSWIMGTAKATEMKMGLTGDSEGLAARQASYSSVEDLSKNLIKAAFSGPNADRLRNIDNNGKKQVELLEVIAKKENPKFGNQRAQFGLAGN